LVYRSLFFHMMLIVLCLGVVSSLKVSEDVHKLSDDYDMCALPPAGQTKPWRARAMCNVANSNRLDNYLETFRNYTLAVERKGNKKKKDNKKGKKKNNNNDDQEAKVIQTAVYEGKFCSQGAFSEDFTPIATVVYSQGKSSKFELKKKKYCYLADCTGRCDGLAASVDFMCVAEDDEETKAKKASMLKVTWYKESACASKDEEDGDEYYYTADEVTEFNSGAQGRFCWDSTGFSSEHSNDRDIWNENSVIRPNAPDREDDYYYSYSTNQKLPVCP